ncbi:uncharacterized protein LAESUDRAFT_812726 [Laetiporus sulphureus 93-53]|uniref:DUF6534 domain-containing protein n=1 Tax=Laetiporus sulphureus 93-53 TaxID=1314785 RepID=A0A165E8D9_9APHY|nr:uncharacterized protein LAESUDRAFT_812726 [Laetiporus sulphureus 93-53]KZT06451.1 hypothetical protein LAESUDRAFT_812726 [Laetiporus sulphureus 93-53]
MPVTSTPGLNGSLGALLLGNLGTAILYGVTSAQTQVYHKHSGKDSLLLRCSVSFLWALSGLHLALITAAVYNAAVTDYSQAEEIMVPSWSLKSHVAVAGLINILVRGLFCHRMWNLSRGNRLLTVTIGTAACVAFAGSLAFSVKSFYSAGDVFHLTGLSWILYTSLCTGVSADIVTAVSLCILLTRYKTGFPSTRGMVRSIIIYGINCGLLTSCCEVSCIVLYATLPKNLSFVALFFVLPELLLNALLATLNARVDLRRRAETSGLLPSSRNTSPRHSVISGKTQITLSATQFSVSQPTYTECKTPLTAHTPNLPQVPIKGRLSAANKCYSQGTESIAGNPWNPFHPRPRESIL